MERKMNSEINIQYSHFWRLFERLVSEFDNESWIKTGRKAGIPVRLSFHILKSTKYYIKDFEMTKFASGKAFDINCETASINELPSIEDIVLCIKEFSKKTEGWIANIDLLKINNDFEWAGKTNLGLLLFVYKHNYYHLGELSSLLNEAKKGEVDDNFVKTLN
jgi:hypothetical protein